MPLGPDQKNSYLFFSISPCNKKIKTHNIVGASTPVLPSVPLPTECYLIIQPCNAKIEVAKAT